MDVVEKWTTKWGLA